MKITISREGQADEVHEGMFVFIVNNDDGKSYMTHYAWEPNLQLSHRFACLYVAGKATSELSEDISE